MDRQCLVCKRTVAQGYEEEHLEANHLGPHYFWFNAQRYMTMQPSMQVARLIALVDTTPSYQLYLESKDNSPDIALGHGEAVDLTQEPHFYAVPPATIWG